MSILKGVFDHFRCRLDDVRFELLGPESASPGYFRFGSNLLCYGNASAGASVSQNTAEAADLEAQVKIREGVCFLPFDPTYAAESVRWERYATNNEDAEWYRKLIRRAYYAVRPVLPVAIRKHLQRAALKDWQNHPFPQWPVDTTIERLFEHLMLLILKTSRAEKIPFVWFWPDRKSGCAVMTHDVETDTGLRFCSTLMDLDDSRGIKSSFQLIPGARYEVSPSVLMEIRSRGFEVNVHDWNHDGHLFADRTTFLDRARKINEACLRFQAEGFRAAVMYRNPDWFNAFSFSYDMSIPNVAHLDPQKGGCCTVMPYFIGSILELPLTATQDYSLFHILRDYSINLWKQQIDIISKAHGFISLNIHPDYIIEQQAQDTYARLLDHISYMATHCDLWLTLPGEVNRWWRERSRMRIVGSKSDLSIEGDNTGRAKIAYAYMDGDRLAYAFG